jgi:hypothetical protein
LEVKEIIEKGYGKSTFKMTHLKALQKLYEIELPKNFKMVLPPDDAEETENPPSKATTKKAAAKSPPVEAALKTAANKSPHAKEATKKAVVESPPTVAAPKKAGGTPPPPPLRSSSRNIKDVEHYTVVREKIVPQPTAPVNYLRRRKQLLKKEIQHLSLTSSY